jgi:lipoprotein-releasing system permease protein
MYKYLLCWRYLRTRYIALASIISVMLGVATMIVVNSVMAGFSTMMEERLHGTLSDIIVESFSLNGFDNPDEVMAAIEEAAGDDIEALAPSLQLFGYALIPVGGGGPLTREVQIIGVRPQDRARVSDFAEYLIHQPRDGQSEPTPAEPSFHVRDEFRLNTYAGQVYQQTDPDDPFADILKQDMEALVPADGMILGYALGTVHRPETGEDMYIAPEGSKVILHFPSAGKTPEARTGEFTVVSYFKSGMSEYDSMQVFVPIERLQFLRGQDGFVNQIQVRVRPGADLATVAQAIRVKLEGKWPTRFLTSTWEQKQGPLLAAVQVEQNILNILLFFIIAVAGFGILGIFSMIVVEKTKDIGILKALGASDAGVRGIFLGYGLTLGMVGSLVGMTGGLLFVKYINEIEDGLSVLTGREVFDDSIYYFPEIPTLVEPLTVAWIVGGTLLIAVAASVWPAQRAARMHPVRSLRYE